MLEQRPRRFWKVATVVDHPPPQAGFGVALDGRPLRLPSRGELRLPGRPLAEAIAEEWNSQGEYFTPLAMPLTRLANTALDRAIPLRDAIIAEMLPYVDTDVLCYRPAPDEEALAAREAAVWDPVLAWAQQRFDAGWQITSGIMPVVQSPDVHAAISRAVHALDPWELTALQVAAPILGSMVTGLALIEGRLSADEAFATAFVDELVQAEAWGEDWEAIERRERLQRELNEVAQFLRLARQSPAQDNQGGDNQGENSQTATAGRGQE